jgi:hypothetical protein
MKDSIRNRLFLGILILTLIYIGTFWLVNFLFNHDYYLYMKKHQLDQMAKKN